MFDLRYHVASLAAVFVALVIGIFVGVGLSGRGFVNDAERKNFEARIDELQADRDSAEAAAKSAARRGDALDAFADTTYTSLVRRRLAGTKVGVVFVGSVDQGLAGTIRRTIADAGGRVVRMRALRVPLDPEAVDQALRGEPDTRELAGEDRRARLGNAIARELVQGGQTPVLDRLASLLVEEQLGLSKAPLDAVVVARPTRPQQGETEDFLTGLYSGLAAASVPSVGVEDSNAQPSAVPPFRAAGLATVDALDTTAGQVALVFLLEGARPGSYGLGQDAVDGVLPAAPLTAPGE
ncbi:MAG TPA: copper transporter [Gaiella sp.]|jgi:copper transport outer membrane protein MctB|nr:copper transporter [Gaiella sp.]